MRRRRQLGEVLAALVAALGLTSLATLGEPVDPPAEGPNIVLITTDDMRLDDLQYMPHTLRLLADEGVTYTQMLSPYPLCCPARASILTGQYSHNNGVQGNLPPRGGYEALDGSDTLAVWLDGQGYQTAFIGKYLNQYGVDDEYEVPPGWDYWAASIGNTNSYTGMTLNENGQTVAHPGAYQTALLARRTTDLVRLYQNADRSFFLWTSYLAPHVECDIRRADEDTGQSCWTSPQPAVQDDRRFESLPDLQNPAINEDDMRDKGRFMQGLRRLSDERLARLRRDRIERLESLQSVDRAVGRLVGQLKSTGQYDDTYIIFTSDNGIHLGEHRWWAKVLGYEPALRVPLIISGPGLPKGVRRDQAVTTVDLAATIADLAGVEPGLTQDGQSLIPLATGAVADTRDRVVPLEAGPLDGASSGWLYRGVRTDRYTLLSWGDGSVELYDRRTDPYQLESVAGDPAYAEIQTRLIEQLSDLQGCAGADCLVWLHGRH